MKGDEFWDYDQQVDLEAFNSQTLYDILSKQAHSTTKELSRQKDEVLSPSLNMYTICIFSLIMNTFSTFAGSFIIDYYHLQSVISAN